MELKFGSTYYVFTQKGVWIEPLWNWNLCWQIERADGICLNWTFMELKFEQRIARRCDMGFELNLYGIEISNFDYVTFSEIVWIEPLWNWNITLDEVSALPTLRLNWTFMELKSRSAAVRRGRFFVWIEPLWNWNYCSLFFLNLQRACLNWTFMELKSYLLAIVVFFETVWIEPLWNWNADEHTIPWLILPVWIEPLWNWNSV